MPAKNIYKPYVYTIAKPVKKPSIIVHTTTTSALFYHAVGFFGNVYYLLPQLPDFCFIF